MLLNVSLIGIAFGLFGLIMAIFMGWRLVACRAMLSRVQNERDLLSATLEAKVAGIGLESRHAVATYFGTLSDEIAAQIQHLEDSQVKSSAGYSVSEEETMRTRLVDRRARFAEYCAALLKTNVQIDQIAQGLKEDRDLITRLLDCLNSHRMDAAMGNLELGAIDKVLRDLDEETVNDMMYDLTTKRRRVEVDHVRKFREAMIQVEERLRKEEVPNPRVIKASRELNED
jgi:hypothetical protein